MGQRMGVAFPEPAVRLFDGPDTEFPAHFVENQALQPVEAVDHHCLVGVILVAESLECTGNFRQAFSQRELRAVDFAQTIFSLNEDRSRSIGSEGRFAHTFLSVNHQAGRPIFAAGGNAFKQ